MCESESLASSDARDGSRVRPHPFPHHQSLECGQVRVIGSWKRQTTIRVCLFGSARLPLLRLHGWHSRTRFAGSRSRSGASETGTRWSTSMGYSVPRGAAGRVCSGTNGRRARVRGRGALASASTGLCPSCSSSRRQELVLRLDRSGDRLHAASELTRSSPFECGAEVGEGGGCEHSVEVEHAEA